MVFHIDHNNFNVIDLEKSVEFYKAALNMREASRSETPGFTLVFLDDGTGVHRIELTWLRDRAEPYDLGDNETHLCVRASDFEAAHELHVSMGCVCYENTEMGLYFIEDPDGYWIEVVPPR